MPRPLTILLYEARMKLGIHTQGALGELLGSSQRTGERWERKQSTPMPEQLHKLAALVYPHDATLAAEIAGHTSRTLLDLGIERPAPPPGPPAPPPLPPPPPPPPPRPEPVHLVDTVVCAAAEAMNMMPEEIRPALRAAFRRARLAGLSVEDVDVGMGSTPGGDAQRG